MGCSTRGWEYRLLICRGSYAALDADWDNRTDSNAPKIFYPITCGLVEVQDHVIVPGTKGSRALFPDQTVKGNRLVGGQVRAKIGRLELDFLLPLILGANEATDVFKVANEVPVFQCLVDKGQGKYMEYIDCKVARATFSASTGGVVDLALDIVAKKEEEYSAAWPSSTLESFGTALGARPIRFAEGSFSHDYSGTPVVNKFESFQLMIDNMIDAKFYAGDDAATCLDEDRRMVTLALPAAHTDAVKNLYKRGFELLTGRLQFVADNMTTKFEFPKLGWAKRGPVMNGDGETLLPLQMRAYRTEAGDSGADDEIKVTNDPIS
jgi:hypothetical protein